MEENIIVEQPKKKSGTFLKVVLIIITLISLVAAAAMGLLYYNAITNLELVREKNIELGEDRDKYKAQAAEYEQQIIGFEQEIADLSKQLAESKAEVETPAIPEQPEDTTNTDTTTPSDTTTDDKEDDKKDDQPAATTSNVDLSKEKTLDVKPDPMYTEVVKYKVIKSGINMRAGPGTNYRTVQSAYQGNIVEAYGESGQWLCIKNTKGVFGWVRNDMVQKLQ